MSFIDEMKTKAKADKKTIVLPEGTDIRVIKAACVVENEAFAHVILLGEKDEIKKVANENGIDISSLEIISPAQSEKKEEYANAFFELRKAKGMTVEKARELMLDETHFGMMMLKLNEVDGLVSGAAHSTHKEKIQIPVEWCVVQRTFVCET